MPWHSIKTRKCKPLTLEEIQWVLNVADSCVTKRQKLHWIRFMGKQQSRQERASLGYRLLSNKRAELSETLNARSTPAAPNLVLAGVLSAGFQYNWK